MRHSSSVIELRVLTPGDWGVWRELRLAALAEAPYAFGSRLSDWTGEGDREERWQARLAIPGTLNVVPAVDGGATGMARGVPAGDGAEAPIAKWASPSPQSPGPGRGLSERSGSR